MSVDITYIKSAIETLDLIQQLFTPLRETQATNKLNDYLAQIESKAVARISSSLGQKLGMDIPVADQEGKSSQYWKGVRDMAKLAKKQFLAFKDDQKFTQFLGNTQDKLSARIEPEKQEISPLEEMLLEVQPASPLEEILTDSTTTPISPSPEPIPSPTPIAPTPEPIPELIPSPTPIAPTPEPIPEPIPSPTPIAPTPEPIPEIKALDPLESSTQPSREPITPITPASEPTPDKLQALDEALKTSGIEETPEVPVESIPSLKDMLLDKDDEGEKDDDDMLSMSLREALKILRDEDDD